MMLKSLYNSNRHVGKNMLGQDIGQKPNWRFPNPRAYSHLGRNGLSHQPLQNQACYFSDWRKDPRVNLIRCLIRRKIFTMLLSKRNHKPESLELGHVVAALENQLFMEASSKEEYANLSTLYYRLRRVIQHRLLGADSVQQVYSTFRASMPNTNTNPSQMLLNIPCTTGRRPLSDFACTSNTMLKRGMSKHTSQFNFRKGQFYTLMSDVRNGTPCSSGIRQDTNEAFIYPENNSHISTKSDGNWNAYNRATISVPSFPQGIRNHNFGKRFECRFQEQNSKHGEVDPIKFQGYGESRQNSNFNLPLQMGEASILSTNFLLPQHGSYNSLEHSVVQSQITDSQMYQQQSHQPPPQFKIPFKQSLVVQNFASEGFKSSKGLDKQADSNYVPHFNKCPTDNVSLSGSLNQLHAADKLNPRKRAISLLDDFDHQGTDCLLDAVHHSKHFKAERIASVDSILSNDSCCNSQLDTCEINDCDKFGSVNQLHTDASQLNMNHVECIASVDSILSNNYGCNSRFDTCEINECDKFGSVKQLHTDAAQLNMNHVDDFSMNSNSRGSGHLEHMFPDSSCSGMVHACSSALSELQNLIQSSSSTNSELNLENMIDFRQPMEDFTSIHDIRMNVVDNDLKQNNEPANFFPEECTVSLHVEELNPTNRITTEENVNIIYDDNMGLQSMQEYTNKTCLVGKDGDDVEIKPTEIELEVECKEAIKTRDPKGSSIAELLKAEEIREHLSSLRLRTDLNTLKRKTGDIENTCQLCEQDKILLTPIPIYCSGCGFRVKRNVNYYCTPDEAAQCFFCTACYKFSQGGNITYQGICISKEKLSKKKNNEENEEAWVQCDKCELWQHQICTLYNGQSDLDGKEYYTCPKCCLKELEKGHYMPGSNAAVFSAKDLPKTKLSDHIEKRIFKCLQQERVKREKAMIKNFDEVPGVEDLVVRVVHSVDRILNANKAFLDIFNDDSYPLEFPYKSKAILLFQKIGGVDVCLFSMYVQEFGSECGQPNQRFVYISYLDSVKYFTPNMQAMTNNESLRTFVYHQILIGYLDFVKKRGFTKCHIWACPPVKGDDYIFYCHPESQRTPKFDQLRKWYKSMLQKAAKDKVVVHWSNLHDQFFVHTGKCNSKITAARLPYFEGCYWSSVAEDILKKIENESRSDSEKKTKKPVAKRFLKAMGHTHSSDCATKDSLLMKELKKNILRVKEDFIIIRLQYVCMRCHEEILSGMVWTCDKCPSYQLCRRCHDTKPSSNARDRHTSTNKEQHLLSQVMVDHVPSDTKDVDENIENDIFENRITFLNFCQRNNCQFDTLRRAKHSTSMILHHLRKSCVSYGEALQHLL